MNPTEAINYLTQQADFCAKRATECDSVETILTYATRGDIYYTLATTLCLLFGYRNPIPAANLGDLGDAEDKARKLNARD